jgi:integrase
LNHELTVAALAKDYLDRHALKNKRPTSIRNDRAMLEGIIVPKLGTLSLAAAGRRDIEALHHSLKATPYRANRVLSLLSKMFSLAMEWKWTTENPSKGIPRYVEDKRETWLSEEQVQSLLAALDQYPDQNAADALRLIVFTGSREGEVLKAEWTQFDLKRGIWIKPSHHVKQKKVEHMPLNDDALKILKHMHAAKSGTFLFPGGVKPGAAVKSKARVTIHRTWVQVCKIAGLATAFEIQGKRRKLTRWKPALRIHDLRHTFASHLVSRGESLHIVGKLLGHTRAETTMRYSHVADEALRKAANRFSEVIAANGN